MSGIILNNGNPPQGEEHVAANPPNVHHVKVVTYCGLNQYLSDPRGKAILHSMKVYRYVGDMSSKKSQKERVTKAYLIYRKGTKLRI